MQTTHVGTPIHTGRGFQPSSPSDKPVRSESVQMPALPPEAGPSPVSPALLFGGLWHRRKNNAIKQMLSAIDHHDTAEVQRLLATGINPNRSHYGATPLMQAALSHQEAMVDLLLAHGADPNVIGDGQTALMWMLSSQQGQNSSAHQRMLEKLAPITNVNIADSRKNTALLLAAQNGHHTVLDSLLAHGAKVQVADKQKMTPLMYAAWNGWMSGMQKMIHALPAEERLAYINARNKWGRTALSIARSSGHEEVAMALVRLGGEDPWARPKFK